jgi:hypothetical protein
MFLYELRRSRWLWSRHLSYFSIPVSFRILEHIQLCYFRMAEEKIQNEIKQHHIMASAVASVFLPDRVLQ